jgi:glutamyl-Q tRNA(Asp) synthetase
VQYIGRFAPSPSGPLHAGSLVVALASYLDARAAGGQWLVRMEDLDTERMVAGADQVILQQLCALGMQFDGEVLYQSNRLDAYQAAFDALAKKHRLYPCGCSRREIADSVLNRHGVFPEGERPYPGTCRDGLPEGRVAKSWRIRVDSGITTFVDRWCGSQTQSIVEQVGDFVLRRADGHWAYQLAVVVDDAAQGITHIVRGQDLLSSTARQRWLAKTLGLKSPTVMHVPLVTDDNGVKLSKQNGAQAIDTDEPLRVLQQAWRHLGFSAILAHTPAAFFEQAIEHWKSTFGPS